MSRIIRLTAENVKRLKAVEIEPDGDVVIVAGRNAQGKTSVLDAIWFALGGGPAQRNTSRPIRDGEEHALAEVELDDLIVTRTWTEGGTYLSVTSKDGAKYRSPQAMLDGLVGRLSFDPLGFANLDARGQLTAMLEVVDLPFDPEQLAAERLGVFDQRTEVNRELKAANARLDAMPRPNPAIPTEEATASDVAEQLGVATAWQMSCNDAARRLSRAEERLAAARRELADAETARDEEHRRREDVLKEGQSSPGVTKPEYDVEALTKRLAGIEELNRDVREQREVRILTERRDELKAHSDALTAELDRIDTFRRTSIEEAVMPVRGLGLDENGVTYQGVPFKQASSSEQLRVSVAMAMALNPTVRVIRISDGSLLDTDSMRLIADMAAERDFQVWIERVDESGQVGVVIEDGQVVS